MRGGRLRSGSGELTGWSTTPKQVTVGADADSKDIELSPMYVSTAQGYPTSEILAVFYTNGTGSSAVHRMRYTNTSTADPMGAWSGQDVKLATDGGSAPEWRAARLARARRRWPSARWRSAASGSPWAPLMR